ncbi:MAG: hypothetical protein ACI4V4_07665 [Eubacterium sp.]
MKKLLSLAMSLVMLLSIELGMNITAQADTEIVAGQTYNVIFSTTEKGSQKITQKFTYTVPAGGYFYYKVIPQYYRSWDDEGKVYEYDNFYLPETKLTYQYKDYVKSTYIRYGENWKSGSLSFPKGTKVTISLTDNVRNNEESSYGLIVYFKKTSNFEIESNNSKKKATKLTAGKTFTGICMDDDTDWWVFTANKTGTYKISATEVSEGFYNSLQAYKGSKKVGECTIRSGEGYKTVFKGKLKKGQKIYVHITNGANDEMYKIKVKKV